MKVRDIMIQPVQTCTTEMNLAATSRRMNETGCGTLAVLKAGRLAGILTDRDLALRREFGWYSGTRRSLTDVRTC